MKKFVVAVAALAMLTGSAYAADWDFYGSARVETFYNDVETINSATADEKNISESLQGNARIGANVKVSDELAGRFEYGASGGNANIRLLYGEWNFGAGTFLVGQDYTLVRFPHSNQAYDGDAGLGGYGELSSPRTAQLKLKFGGLQLAAVAPTTEFLYANRSTTAGVTSDALNSAAAGTTSSAAGVPTTVAAAKATEVKLPGLQAKYIFTGDNYFVSGVAALQTFEIDPNGVSDDVTSYVIGVGGSVTFGAATLAAQVYGGQNISNMADANTGGTGKGYAKWNNTTNQVIDSDAFGYSIVLGYTVNDMLGLEVGYGSLQCEYDENNGTDDEVTSYYLQAPITLAPGVMVVPEIGVMDEEETGQSETTYFGAKWQINF